MPHRSMGILVLGLALVLGGCAAETPYNPFKIPRERFHDQLKVVALSPIGMPRELTKTLNPARRKFLTLIETQLRGAGYTVVGARRGRHNLGQHGNRNKAGSTTRSRASGTRKR